MRRTTLTLPLLALIAATRGMMGVGLGLLLSTRIAKRQRIIVGAALATVGALSTIPIAFKLFNKDDELPAVTP